MSLIAALRANDDTDVLTRLRAVCGSHGLGDLGSRLEGLSELVRWDLADVEEVLAHLPDAQNMVQRAAGHLLDLGGKRLRPMCVALACRTGRGFGPVGRELAVAVELVHSATLLHDDVVDLGEVRRGKPAARTVYGNAASVFAGDFLLIEALKRVRAVETPDVLERLLAVIEEMIFAESIQLEHRGRVQSNADVYFQVVEGKTAALFRWAMFAGGRAGGLDAATCAALEAYGLHLGVAFQLVDDLLDYAGDKQVTGKELFADLREGKTTYPLLVALDRKPALMADLERVIAAPPGPLPVELQERLLASVTHPEVVTECRALAARRAEEAVRHLSPFEDGPAKAALVTVAEATVHREA
ncbi:MAG: polyprenyl synthetase family protein [Myxococcota bacterium]